MDVDVVIVTWRGREVLRSCLNHLARQSRAARIIVVDNASQDGTIAMVKAWFPGVTLLEMPSNLGFGRAVNAGVAAGTAAAIVLVNNDVECEPRFVERIVRPLEADASVGMVAGLTLQPGPAALVDGFGIALDPALSAYNRIRNQPFGTSGKLLAGPSGGAAAYRRSAFEGVAGFDSRLFAYAEDVDLLLRLRLAGWAAASASEARGIHLGGATIGVDSPSQRRLAAFGRGFVLRRYGIFRSRAAARALLIEALVVVWGLLRHGTSVPLQGRVAGWRAAGRGWTRPPSDAIDTDITVWQAIAALRTAR